MATLFIADLHLSEDQPVPIARLLELLRHLPSDTEALYILGDLFEAWLGDDLIPPFCQPILHAMRQLTQQGIALYLMHGNRDFLLGPVFCQLSGGELLDDPAVIDLYGTPTLLMHGDRLCSDDLDYQAMRQQLRQPEWIATFLAKPAEERIAFARQLRQRSQQESRQKPEQIMDVNPDTVATTMQQHQVRHLIHGHTHRPAQHQLDLHGEPAWRHVLPDWQSQPGALRCDPNGCRLINL